MLKKIYVVTSFLIVFVALLVGLKTLERKEQQVISTPEPVLGEMTEESVLDIQDFRVSWFFADPASTNLIANFSGVSITQELMNQNECKFGINGGFYQSDSDENKPIGLFITNSEVLNPYRTNNLFNGIFSINQLDTARITSQIPRDELKIAVQTGPVILENDDYKNYSRANDKNARRMLALITGENKLIFMTVYDKTAVFGGPKLSQLASILEEFENNTKINLADAINLDGGSASAFYGQDSVLKEISPVGSFFCVK